MLTTRRGFFGTVATVVGASAVAVNEPAPRRRPRWVGGRSADGSGYSFRPNHSAAVKTGLEQAVAAHAHLDPFKSRQAFFALRDRC